MRPRPAPPKERASAALGIFAAGTVVGAGVGFWLRGPTSVVQAPVPPRPIPAADLAARPPPPPAPGAQPMPAEVRPDGLAPPEPPLARELASEGRGPSQDQTLPQGTRPPMPEERMRQIEALRPGQGMAFPETPPSPIPQEPPTAQERAALIRHLQEAERILDKAPPDQRGFLLQRALPNLERLNGGRRRPAPDEPDPEVRRLSDKLNDAFEAYRRSKAAGGATR